MLIQLHREIETRAQQIAASQGSWPCREGCDSCCRSLAEPPRLTAAEWDLVEAGIARLPEPLRTRVLERIPTSSRICPFLDTEAGSCLIYDHRPVACRTYGFYVERDRGLYCRVIETKVDAGEMEDVVWGNAESVESRLSTHGDKISLMDWFNDSLRASPGPAPTRSSGCPDPCDAP
jgi:Fe-S-cluster containining protein